MQLIKELLPKVYLFSLNKIEDVRGDFLKIYNLNSLKKYNIDFVPNECYLSTSSLNVIRGMHYQVSNYAHNKLITCFRGEVLDVIVDVRKDSVNYNKPISCKLKSDLPQAIYIGKGYAHGFLSLKENSTMSYLTSTVYDPSSDCGVLWSSINFEWPIADPIISDRDKFHPKLGNHKCEFF